MISRIKANPMNQTIRQCGNPLKPNGNGEDAIRVGSAHNCQVDVRLRYCGGAPDSSLTPLGSLDKKTGVAPPQKDWAVVD